MTFAFFAPFFSVLKKIPREVWLIALALLAVWWWGNHRYAAGRDDMKAEIEANSLQAERRANTNDDKREDAREADHDATEKKLKEIEDADPDAAKAPAGAGTRAVADRLR